MSLAHLRALIWLRFRLSRNRFARGKRWVAVLGMVLRTLGVLLSAALAAAAFLLGRFVLDDAPAWVLAAVWAGAAALFLFSWMMGVLSEVQRSEAIDVRRLMHLPISLRQVFLINYVVSLFTPGLILAVPAACALTMGLVLGRGPHMAWLFAVLFAFFFAVTAWTYCLRGWLVNLMINKRRRRAIVVALTAVIILAGQAPNLLFNSPQGRKFMESQVKARKNAESVQAVSVFSDIVASAPPAQLALPFAAVGTLLGAWGLRRAHRVTVGFYTAEEGRAKRRRPRREPRAIRAGDGPRRLLVERRLPFVEEPVSALTTALLRSHLRAPELRMQLLMPVVMAVVFGVMFLGGRASQVPSGFQGLSALAVVGLATMTMAGISSNSFGFDRDALRSLLLQPVDSRGLLLAKNLALLPFPLGVGVLLLLAVAVPLHLPPWTLLASLMQVAAAAVLICIPGNYISTRAPIRLPAGSMRKPHIKGDAFLFVLLGNLSTPLFLFPVAVPPLLGMGLAYLNPFLGALANLAGSAGVLLLAVLAYRLILPAAARYLDTRALHILETVTGSEE